MLMMFVSNTFSLSSVFDLNVLKWEDVLFCDNVNFNCDFIPGEKMYLQDFQGRQLSQSPISEF